MIAKESFPFLLITGIPCGILITLGQTADSPLASAVGTLLFVLTAFIAFFFRDPDRSTPEGSNLCVASGDGKVVLIQEVEDEWVGEAVQISVFLSIFNVHINRLPCSGRISSVDHRSGKFRLAFLDKASDDNEHTIVRIEGSYHRIAIKQIAGFVARRIIFRLDAGQTVSAGERFGLIRFGSRVDHILPIGSEITVQLGDRVRGGETIIGVLNHEKINHEKVSDT